MNLRDYLKKHRLLMDGAMGTYYGRLINDDRAVPEFANLTAPACIEGIHLEYIRAGARMIRTNTFAMNRYGLKITQAEQVKLIKTGCDIAKSAVLKAKSEGIGEPIFIAGSIGPISRFAEVGQEGIKEEYELICDTMLSAGVDAILFETFDDTADIRKVVKYVREKSDVFLMINFALDKNGYSGKGISGKRLMEEAGNMEGLDACGFNCGIGSGHMKQLLNQIQFPKEKYIAILPNAGYPEQIHSRMLYQDNEEYFTKNMEEISHYGIHMIGGCCGTTPSYIASIRKIIRERAENVAEQVEVRSVEQEHVQVEPNPFMELFQNNKKVVAVELDPPYDADVAKVLDCAHIVKNADIITIADSPMGRSRVDSILMSLKIMQETGHLVMPHMCCRDRNMIAMRSTILGAYVNGIRNFLFVTGDPVPSVSRVNTTPVFDYNSIQLMEGIKEMNTEQFPMDPVVYGGALNYGRGKLENVAERMKRKVEAGASYFLTQPVYSEEDVERIHCLKKMVDTKILCGILPFVSYRNANFVKNELTGIHVPEEIVARYHKDMTREEAELTGASVANEIIEKLKDVADGYYFMLPFNRVSLMDKIIIR